MAITNAGIERKALAEEVALMHSQVNDIANSMHRLEVVLIIGNGEPSIKEQVHHHASWIDNINRIIWIVGGAFLGQLIITITTLLWIVLQLASQHGLLFNK